MITSLPYYHCHPPSTTNSSIGAATTTLLGDSVMTISLYAKLAIMSHHLVISNNQHTIYLSNLSSYPQPPKQTPSQLPLKETMRHEILEQKKSKKDNFYYFVFSYSFCRYWCIMSMCALSKRIR